MKPFLLALLLLFPVVVNAQTSKAASKPPSELTKLRDEFVRLTNEYKASLKKLLPFYESDVKRAEERLEQSKRLLAEVLISRAQVEENERALAISKEKLAEINRQIANADQQIAGVLDDAKLQQEYKQALQQRRKGRKPRCSNWTMTASQRTTSRSVSYSYKFVCQN